MFEVLLLAILGIYLGDFLRKKFPILVKYCLPSAVVGGTIISIITMILYYAGIIEPDFDFKTVNTFFLLLIFCCKWCSSQPFTFKARWKTGSYICFFGSLTCHLSKHCSSWSRSFTSCSSTYLYDDWLNTYDWWSWKRSKFCPNSC